MQLKGYLVSSKLAQKFWRREERPVVLMLTDKCGWYVEHSVYIVELSGEFMDVWHMHTC
jgi:hypothetical protein